MVNYKTSYLLRWAIKNYVIPFLKITISNNFDIAISWKTWKIQTLFHLKEKKLYQACKFTMGFANVEKITSLKQKGTP